MLQDFSLKELWLRLPEWLRAILYLGVGGIIGNHADSFVTWIAGQLAGHVEVNGLVLAGIVVAVAIIPGTLWYRAMVHRRRLSWSLDRVMDLQKMDEVLLTNFAVMVRQPAGQQRRRVMKKLLEDYLRFAVRAMPTSHVARATILRPNGLGEFLVPWAEHEVPITSLRAMRFDIRKDSPGRRSVAAQTFLDGKPRLVQFQTGKTGKPVIQRAEDAGWVLDEEAEYQKHTSDGDKPRYETFVVLPLIGKSGECLGVICLDSKERDAFSASAMRPVLDALSRRAVPVIETFVGLQRVPKPQASDRHAQQPHGTAGNAGPPITLPARRARDYDRTGDRSDAEAGSKPAV